MSEPALSIRSLAVHYGRVSALEDVSMEIGDSEVVALLGANGAGKTTLINTICGFLKPSSGEIRLAGKTVTGLPPHATFDQGIVQVSQGRDLFPSMTVQDNLELGAARRGAPDPEELERAFEYFPRLRERSAQQVGTLSGGEQQMVAIARALIGRPKILLLDEPSGGLAPRFVQEISRIMRVLKENGSTMMIVEQNIGMALGIADRFYVIRGGAIIESGQTAGLGDDHKALAQKFFL